MNVRLFACCVWVTRMFVFPKLFVMLLIACFSFCYSLGAVAQELDEVSAPSGVFSRGFFGSYG